MRELVTGTHKTKPMGRKEVINAKENQKAYKKKRSGPVCLTSGHSKQPKEAGFVTTAQERVY